jgi:hypothetical protein
MNTNLIIVSMTCHSVYSDMVADELETRLFREPHRFHEIRSLVPALSGNRINNVRADVIAVWLMHSHPMVHLLHHTHLTQSRPLGKDKVLMAEHGDAQFTGYDLLTLATPATVSSTSTYSLPMKLTHDSPSCPTNHKRGMEIAE